MQFTAKSLAGLLSVSGIGSAVGVTTLTNIGKIEVHKVEGGAKMTPVSINRCSASSTLQQKVVNFGDNSSGSICGEVAEGTSLEKESEYSKLFSEKWEKKQDSGSDSSQGSDGGKTVCNSSGVISTQGNGKEYLGKCGGDDDSKVLFVMKEKDNSQSVKIQVCDENCFNNDTRDYSQIRNLSNIGTGGKNVSFKTV